MDSPVRKMLKRNDYARHKLLRKIKRLRKTKLELESHAAEKQLRKKLKIPKFDMGLNPENENDQSTRIETRKNGYFLKRGLSNYLLEREFNSLDERLLNMSYNGYTTSDPYFKALSDRHANLLYKLMLPDYKQMTAGAIGSASNIGQIITGNGDFIDYLGLGGGAFGMLGGSLVLRRLGMRGVLADNIVDNLGHGLTGIDFTKTLGELGYEGYNTYFNLK